jgi:phage nucleotide-binding protein
VSDELVIKSPTAEPRAKILFYGEPGTGKTTLAGSAPKPLFIDVDRGMMALAGQTHIAVVEAGAERSIVTDLEDIYKLLIGGQHDYETVVVDTITELQRKLADDIKEAQYTANPSTRDRDMMTMQDWGKNTAQTRRVLRALIDLPMHVIFVAQEGVFIDELRGNAAMRMPSLTPKIREDVMAMTSIIGYLGISQKEETKGQRALVTQSTGMLYAKDRSGRLPSPMMEPTVPKMLDLIWGKGESSGE